MTDRDDRVDRWVDGLRARANSGGGLTMAEVRRRQAVRGEVNQLIEKHGLSDRVVWQSADYLLVDGKCHYHILTRHARPRNCKQIRRMRDFEHFLQVFVPDKQKKASTPSLKAAQIRQAHAKGNAFDRLHSKSQQVRVAKEKKKRDPKETPIDGMAEFLESVAKAAVTHHVSVNGGEVTVNGKYCYGRKSMAAWFKGGPAMYQMADFDDFMKNFVNGSSATRESRLRNQ